MTATTQTRGYLVSLARQRQNQTFCA
jgi:hypothetical protein